jgi:hypothetical protein
MISVLQNDPLKNIDISPGFHRILVLGSSNSGKSWGLITLLPKLYPPNEIYIFSHTINQPIYNYAISKYNDPNIIVHKYNKIPTPDLLYNEENRLHFKSNTHTLMIFDDVNKKEMEKKIIPFFTISRHLNISVILIYQRFFDIDISIRYNTTMILQFRSGFGYTTLYNEVKQYFKNNKEYFDQCMDLLHKKEHKYQFICIDMAKFENIVTLNFNGKIKFT